MINQMAFIFLNAHFALAVIREVEMKSIEVITKQNEIVNKGKVIAIEKEAAEEMITTALQRLQAAKSRLIDLNESELNEMLEIETPPETIEIIGECFIILKGIRDVSWKTVRSIMAEESFLDSLMEMNCDVITSKQLFQCKNHIKVSLKCASHHIVFHSHDDAW